MIECLTPAFLIQFKQSEADFFNESLGSAVVLRPKLHGSDISGKVDALNRILAVCDLPSSIIHIFTDSFDRRRHGFTIPGYSETAIRF